MTNSVRTRVVRTLLLAGVASAAIGGTASASDQATIPASAKEAGSCEAGEFCTWPQAHFTGQTHRVDLRTANPNECIPLPDDTVGRAFANLTDRHVTVYQGRDCSTEADFTTYPGGGTYVPEAPFVVRALQVWE